MNTSIKINVIKLFATEILHSSFNLFYKTWWSAQFNQ